MFECWLPFRKVVLVNVFPFGFTLDYKRKMNETLAGKLMTSVHTHRACAVTIIITTLSP